MPGLVLVWGALAGRRPDDMDRIIIDHLRPIAIVPYANGTGVGSSASTTLTFVSLHWNSQEGLVSEGRNDS